LVEFDPSSRVSLVRKALIRDASSEVQAFKMIFFLGIFGYIDANCSNVLGRDRQVVASVEEKRLLLFKCAPLHFLCIVLGS